MSLLAYVSYVSGLPLIISAINTLKPAHGGAMELYLDAVNGVLWVFVIGGVALLMFRGGHMFKLYRERRKRVT